MHIKKKRTKIKLLAFGVYIMAIYVHEEIKNLLRSARKSLTSAL